MEELVLSTFSDTKPILKNDIETMLLKKNVIDNETSIEINNTLDKLLERNVIGSHTFKENNKNITFYWKKRKIDKEYKKNSNNININKIKLNKSSPIHKNSITYKSSLLRVSKLGHGISKSFRSPLINSNAKDKLKSHEIGLSKNKTITSNSMNLKSRNLNRNNTTQLLKFKKDKELICKIKERDLLLNQLKQKEENIRRINLVLKHRETNEIEKLKSLVVKWRKTSQNITEVLKEKIGKVMAPNIFDNGFELKEVTLEQILNGLNINPSILNYNKEEDCFN